MFCVALLAPVVTVVGQPAEAQTTMKPIPVKAVSAESGDTISPTRVAAGFDPTAPKGPDTTEKPRVTTKSKAKSLKVRLAAASFPSAADILSNKSVIMSEQARNDIRTGAIDPRVLGTIGAVAKRFTLEIRTLRTGHSRFVAGTNRESDHYYGRAADIVKVNGVAVTRDNQDALALANLLLTLPGDFRPDELGSPWSGDGSSAAVEVFTDDGHDDHIHFGFDE
jgi:hypothetical protein